MKTIYSAALLGLFALLSFTASAQRFAYVNSDYILSKIPEYEQAQKTLDETASAWRQEITLKQAEIEKLYRDFQNEQFLLTDEQKQLKIKGIEDKEKDLQAYQKTKFGYEGEMFEQRKELIKPIQDRIYNAIEELAEDRGYDFIFDKANSTTLLFANPDNDRSDLILRKLGIDQ